MGKRGAFLKLPESSGLQIVRITGGGTRGWGTVGVQGTSGDWTQRRWGAKWPQEPERVPSARSPPEPPGPNRQAQRRSGLPELSLAQGGEEDRAPGVCALERPGPWRPGVSPERAAPGCVRSLFRPGEDGEGRGWEKRDARPRALLRRCLGPARSTQVYFLHLHT
ncbi:hypothetical protein HPG69_003488 [Diceros bicornis minor]|uniref:Uncharacterized protein n=1 Tax=Diceros bicornis minor TaxID=77932 RepID=A0A7J7E8T2_DICBM|nr:hypothetical protein HPG69_003488 [Diceros bicornis minor]